ncbi:Plasmid transfer ATPase TraJ [Burkholderia diffusa]|uniref:plasmid transfer ATPase TraJ n=1 Tax=Burkholderia diffusa TaxID=488732 RepID=UPI001CB4A520|nr:plasmid transfer ATPase TraJ [Burkholderia diffusa]CAG9261006.1 Plasmid transfer ATPase TraJ [Burkholderia diffusa]
MSAATVDFEPFDFRGDMNPHTFKQFLKHCADQGASDILIQGGDYAWAELHGRQRRASPNTIKQGHLSSLISSVWQADVENAVRAGHGADRTLELSGEELGIQRGKYLRFRTNFIQGRVGRQDMAYAITMRVIPTDLPDIHTMGIEPDLFRELYPAKGIGLVCGPTGSGKTTVLTAIYTHAGAVMPDRKVITYEDPIEFVLGGSHWKGPQPHQAQIGRDIESFAAGLRNAMRRKPAIIGVGELRDLETIDAAVQAGLTGHTTYCTMHTDSCAETVNRAIQVYPPQQQSSVASSLLGTLRFIIVQRLLKTTDGKRTAIREYIIFDRDLKNELQAQPHEQWARMIRMRLESQRATLADRAWSLYEEGRIDSAEFIELAGYKEFELRTRQIA